jgi:hypothetical protein
MDAQSKGNPSKEQRHGSRKLLVSLTCSNTVIVAKQIVWYTLHAASLSGPTNLSITS